MLPSEMHSKQRAVLRALALTLSSVVLLVLLLELVFRLANIAPDLPKAYADGVYVSDPVLPYRLAPGISRNVLSRSGEFHEQFTHNSAGFRDVEHSLQKPEGVFRILALGDSFTYGAGAPFEQTWLFLLERKLAERAGGSRRVEIIKAGIGGYFPESERLLLEHVGLAYSPDLVIVGYNTSDLFETWQGLDEVRLHDGYLKTASARRLGKTGTFLFLHSHAARSLLDLTSKYKRLAAMRAFESRRGEAWGMVEAEYDRMLGLLPPGVRMAIVFIPFPGQAFGEDLERLLAYGKSRNVLVVDAGTILCRGQGGEEPLFWPKDGHCTPRGYAVVAGIVFDALVGAGLVP